jgi:hypothetical protein
MHHDFVQQDLLGRAAHDAPAAAATAAQESHQASATSEQSLGERVADSRNLENRRQQGPKARDVSEAGHTQKQLADRVGNAILHSNDRMAELAEVVSELSQAMLYASEIQQHLGADAAASAASAAQHAHQTERCTRLSATSAAIAGLFSAHSAAFAVWQPAGPDQAEL